MPSKADLLVTGATVITPEVAISGGAVAVSAGKICYVGVPAGAPAAARTVEFEDGYLLPGFVDLHCHGGGGCDATFGRYDPETRAFSPTERNLAAAAREIASVHLARGTTTICLATCAAAEPDLLRALSAVGGAVEAGGLPSRVLGINLEGTYLKTPAFAGAQNPENFRTPSPADFDRLNAAARGRIRIVNVAPEHGPAAVELVRHLVARKVVAASGHTGADFAEMQACIDAGVTLAVHFSNGPSATSFKPPGMAMEAMLGDRRVTLELIADGYHINPRYLLSFLAAKGFRGALITDAMAPLGLEGVTSFAFGGKTGQLSADGGVLRLAGSATVLFGSVLTMDRAVANLVKWLVDGVPGMYQNAPVIPDRPMKEEALVPASRLASGHPAEVLGLRDRLGAIEQHLLADLVWLDEDLAARRVWLEGREVDSGGD
ncbi:MAG TPA: amidohydrolase family protein [Planctomycetota bacterium]|nr:amidohydrolase family protein [Planctomycetota bacterium]